MRGHIRKRKGKNGDSWQLIYYVGRKPDGRPDYKSCTVKGTSKDAEAKLAEIINSINYGEYVPPGKENVDQYLTRWLEEIKPTVRNTTWVWYEVNCRLHLIPTLGHIKLTKLTPLQIQSAYRKLLGSETSAKGRQSEGLSANSVRGVHRTLRRALGQAVKWGLISRNPADQVEQPKAEKTRPQVLTAENVDEFLSTVATTAPDRYSLYLAAITTGMRQGELLGLRWQDIDFKNRVAAIRQQLVKAGREPKFQPPKTDAGERRVLLPDSLVESLKKHKKKQDEEREYFGEEYLDYDLVWTVPGGSPIEARNLLRQFKSLLEQAGLSDMRFHDLRHTHATLLLEAGVHPKVVQERLGHSDIGITMDTYSHVMPNLQRDAAGLIDNILTRENKH